MKPEKWLSKQLPWQKREGAQRLCRDSSHRRDVANMLSQALDCFVRQDVELALKVAQEDKTG